MKRPSTLALFVAVAGLGLLSLLLYAGFFYSNARRAVQSSSEDNSSVYPSKEAAEDVANQWIALGGVYVVQTLKNVRRSVPLSELEKIKLRSQREQSLRRKIEDRYSACLAQAENDLAKELCSFGPYGVQPDPETKIPKVKTIEVKQVQNAEYPRRKCTHVHELRSFDCVELDVARDSIVSDLDPEPMPVKVRLRFNY